MKREDRELVERVCRTIRGECQQCPEREMVHGEAFQRGCFAQAVECINVVETGNPWRKTEGVKPPWTTRTEDRQRLSAEVEGGNSSSRDHAHTADVALENVPTSPPESYDLEPGESYAKWAVAQGVASIDELLRLADLCAGHDDPGFDASLGARFILSRHAIRAALSSAEQVPGDSSREALNPNPAVEGT